MIERFDDSLRKASARAVEFNRTPLEKRPALFVDFIDGLKVAAGSAHQLAHTQENPHFLKIRDTIESVIEVGQVMPTMSDEHSGLWLRISNSLEGIRFAGMKQARGSVLSRQQVLTELALREQAERLKNDQ